MLRPRKVSGKRERAEAPGLWQIYRRRQPSARDGDVPVGATAYVLVTEVDSEAGLVRLEPVDPVTLERALGGRHRTASWRTLGTRYTRAAGLEQQRDSGRVLAGEIDRRAACPAVDPLVPLMPHPAGPPHETGGIAQLVDSALLSEIRQVRGILADVRDMVKILTDGAPVAGYPPPGTEG